MKRLLAALATGVLGATACTADGPTEETRTASAPVGAPPAIEAFFVVLDGPGAVTAIPPGVDPRSPAAADATRKRLSAIEREQAALEPALAAHGAQVIARISRLANALEMLTDEATARRIEKLPGVRRVERVPLVERALDSAVPLVGAPQVWGGTPGLAGEGITIGIIDSGIDYTHADFAGLGTSADYIANDPTLIEPGTFPTTKVVGGWDFVGDAYNPTAGLSSPNPDQDPLDCATVLGEQISGGHGTHVAGIAAGTGVASDGSSFSGPYDPSIYAATFRVAPGVAPRAKLYALKIFGCQGSTTLLASALDRAADPNLDGSFDDRLDVVNASLGTPYGLGSSMVGEMVTALTDVGTLMVAAAGNEGQSFFVTGSPASYPEVLSVAASVDSNLFALRVTAPASAIAAYPAAESNFSARLAAVGALDAPIVEVAPAGGCSAFTNAAEVSGKIALIDRGTCAFIDKVTNAVAAGAVGVVIADNEDVPLPFVMDGPANGSPIPTVMVRLNDGAELHAALAQGAVTVSLDPEDHFTGPGAELIAGFSSRGPSPIDGRLKPEITAPGVAILSAGVGTGTEAVNNQGTSMASPVVAGAAALVRQAHPELGPIEVKATLMNAASSISDFAGATYGSGVIGAGRLDVARAVQSRISAAADPTSGEVGVSFGSIITTDSTTVDRTFVVTNHGATAASLDATVAPTFALPGLAVTVAPTHLELAAAESATVTLTLTLDPVALGNPGPDPGTPATQGQQTPLPRHYLNQASGAVSITSAAGESLVLPYTGSLRGGSDRHGVPPSACDPVAAPGEPMTIALDGAGPFPDPIVSAFQLGTLDEADPDSETDPIVAMADLRAVGVATDLATAASFDEAQVFFGIAVAGPWSTPARGPLSVVKVQIDSDQTGGSEYEIRLEPRNPDPPYRDVLVASTYDLATGVRSGRYPVNILTPDVAQTSPFNSTVIVLSAHLAELGINPDNPVFDWTAATERPDLLLANDKANGTFDAAHPIIDTAAHGQDGAPIFGGAGPILVDVSAESRAAGGPLDVLLLHHTNVPGKQWEVVSLVQTARSNLTLTGNKPEGPIASSATTEVSMVVSNSGPEAALDVVVSGSAGGGQIVSAASSQGSCTGGATLSCTLGELAPGASVELTATVRPAAGQPLLSLQATVASGFECETTADDNTVAFAIDVNQPAGGSDDPLDPGGGCDCRAAGNASRGAAGAACLLAALGMLTARRRAHAPRHARKP